MVVDTIRELVACMVPSRNEIGIKVGIPPQICAVARKMNAVKISAH